MAKKSIKIPKQKRKYHSIYALDKGLDYSMGSTLIGDAFTPHCHEMDFRNRKIAKAKGTLAFAGTDTVPLLNAAMHFDHYYLMSGTSKLVGHTYSNIYAYNTDTKLFENITRGLSIQDCEDNTDWTANANVTLDDSTDVRKGTNSLEVTIETAFVTGIAVYDNFGPTDYSTYTHLHFFIRSDTATLATDLDIRLSEEDNGAITGGAAVYEDVSIPALVAGVWQEVSVKLSTTTTKRNALQSVSLVVAANQPEIVVNIDDIVATIETTGDEDDQFTSELSNDLYLYSNNIAPLMFWNMATATSTILYAGCTLGAKCMRRFGERVCLYGVTSTYPQRVQWTIVGGVTAVTPVATDWTAAGSGDTDLISTMGVDHIQTAEKLGNYMVIYGERTIVLQDYIGLVDEPFAFYTRVSGIGLAAERAIVNLGNEHIFLGWDDIYSYKGGKEAVRIGGHIKDELFSHISAQYINRSFMTYVEEKDEIRLYIVTHGHTTPDMYFSYSLENESWSRGTRAYTGYGYFTRASADTWASAGSGATDTWDNQTLRWDSMILEALAPLNIYGNASGAVSFEDETELNLLGVAIDGYFETKDFVTGDGYRRTLTNWMEFNFEAKGDKIYVRYSTDLGVSWSEAKIITLSGVWKKYNYDFNANAPQVRFRLRNGNVDEDFEVRQIEIGYIDGSDRGV